MIYQLPSVIDSVLLSRDVNSKHFNLMCAGAEQPSVALNKALGQMFWKLNVMVERGTLSKD